MKLNDSAETINIINSIIFGNYANFPSTTPANLTVEGYAASAIQSHSNIGSGGIGLWNTKTNVINADPLFFDPANGDFHLQPNSPCINTGLAGPDVPALDLDGVPRDSQPDIGAYEFNTTIPHPADADQNWLIDLTEFNTYNEAWRAGTAWNGAAIDMDYATRAGLIQTKGGNYRNTGARRPLNWTPTAP